MSPQRWAVWGGLAVLAALALGLAPAPPSETVDAVARQPVARLAAAARGGAAAPAAPDALPQVARILPRVADSDAALPRLWPAPPAVARPAAASVVRAPAPPPAPPPMQAPAPAAPALAYRFVGRYADDTRLGVILQGPDGQVSLAHAGEALGNDYRVESIVGNSMVLRYLPLNLLQTLDIGITR